MATAEEMMVHSYLVHVESLGIAELAIARAVQKIGESTSSEEPWPLLVEAVDLIDEVIAKAMTDEIGDNITAEMEDHDWEDEDEDVEPIDGSLDDEEYAEAEAQRKGSLDDEETFVESLADMSESQSQGKTWEDMEEWVSRSSAVTGLASKAKILYDHHSVVAEQGPLGYGTGYSAGIVGLTQQFLDKEAPVDSLKRTLFYATKYALAVLEDDPLTQMTSQLDPDEKRWSEGYDDGYRVALSYLREMI